MEVVAVVGPSGAGKTTLIDSLPGTVRKHKEGYVEKDDETLFIDNRTYVSKLRYLSAWYLEMISLKSKQFKKIVSDRCPFDVAAYVKDQELQHAIVRECMDEIARLFDIEVRTVYVRASLPECERRVVERLSREPWRKLYHEDDLAFLGTTWEYYERHLSDWNIVVQNEGDLQSARQQMLDVLSV